jgi:hypothetical protein
VQTLAIKLLDEAKASECGVAVTANDVKRLATSLQKAIDSHGPLYSNLSVELSRDNPRTEVWIVKNDG